jgi:hypothetical protein
MDWTAQAAGQNQFAPPPMGGMPGTPPAGGGMPAKPAETGGETYAL